jgi:hypothetical protein
MLGHGRVIDAGGETQRDALGSHVFLVDLVETDAVF